jgi:putative peptidoglycan lipid II flippase
MCAARGEDTVISSARPETATSSLARGAALITLATAASRLTGFIRVVVVAGAMGTTFLANTYQTANTAPNLIFELAAAGILTSVFVPTFVSYIVSDRRDEGWDTANVLTSVALVALAVIAALLALAAPLAMRVLTLGVADQATRAREIVLGTTFLRLFAPQIVFYGAGMVMTSALHAYRRFGMPAVAPIFNNVVVIGVYITYSFMRRGHSTELDAITTAETWVLGGGTTLGVVALTLCLVPSLRRIGWRYRFRFTPRHEAVRKAARVGAWALGYAGGYQAGLLVVLVLANGVAGGVAAYQWAYTFFYLPHALFAVPIFHVLFTAMAEHIAKEERSGFTARLQEGLRMLFFILIPIASFLAIAGGPLARITLQYGVMTGEGAALVGRVITAFAIGLPAYSTFLVLTRAYYALGDTKTPALVNAATVAGSSVVGGFLFYVLDGDWSVPGLAAGHSIAFTAGAIVLMRKLSRDTGTIVVPWMRASMLRSLTLGILALGAMAAVHSWLPETSKLEAATNLLAAGATGALVYLGAMMRVRAPELQRVLALVRRRGQNALSGDRFGGRSS